MCDCLPIVCVSPRKVYCLLSRHVRINAVVPKPEETLNEASLFRKETLSMDVSGAGWLSHLSGYTVLLAGYCLLTTTHKDKCF